MPKPEFENSGKDFWVIFRKDIYNEISLKKLGINERQIKAVLYAKENNRISNKEYQNINDVSKRTATNDLTELVDKFKILNKIGTSGAGIYYKLMGQ